MFREFLSLDETTSYQTQYMYFSQILYLHISLLTIFLKSRYSICKYTNLLASLTSILISMNNSVIPQLFRTIIKVWPIGLAEKVWMREIFWICSNFPSWITSSSCSPRCLPCTHSWSTNPPFSPCSSWFVIVYKNTRPKWRPEPSPCSQTIISATISYM